jgi:hypothetical protein
MWKTHHETSVDHVRNSSKQASIWLDMALSLKSSSQKIQWATHHFHHMYISFIFTFHHTKTTFIGESPSFSDTNNPSLFGPQDFTHPSAPSMGLLQTPSQVRSGRLWHHQALDGLGGRSATMGWRSTNCGPIQPIHSHIYIYYIYIYIHIEYHIISDNIISLFYHIISN